MIINFVCFSQAIQEIDINEKAVAAAVSEHIESLSNVSLIKI